MREEVAALQAGLAQRVAGGGVRWVRPTQLHLTLVFLGQVRVTVIPALTEALRCVGRESSAMQLRAGGWGSFPRDRAPRVVWIGVEGELEALGRLQERVAVAVARFAGHRERNPFSPHLTVGRIQTRRMRVTELASMTALAEGFRAEADWPVSGIELVQSVSGPAGASYHTLAVIPLGAAAGDIPG